MFLPSRDSTCSVDSYYLILSCINSLFLKLTIQFFGVWDWHLNFQLFSVRPKVIGVHLARIIQNLTYVEPKSVSIKDWKLPIN